MCECVWSGSGVRYGVGFSFLIDNNPIQATYTFTQIYVIYTNVRISIQMAEGNVGHEHGTLRSGSYARHVRRMNHCYTRICKYQLAFNI